MIGIVDAQLPQKLCEILEKIGIKTIHVDDLPDGDETPDNQISEFADQNNIFVITKDSDFYHSYMVKNQPKKLFLISTGNIKNKQLFDLIRNNSIIISEMLKRKNFLELTNSGIIN